MASLVRFNCSIGRAQRILHLGRAVGCRNRLDHLGGLLHVAALGIQAGQVQHHFLGIRLHGLRDLELFFGLLLVVLDGIELAQNHAILDVLRLERDDLLEFRNRLVQHIAGGRGGGRRILPFAQRAQVDAPQQLVRVDIVGRALQQLPRRALRLARAAGAEVQVGQRQVSTAARRGRRSAPACTPRWPASPTPGGPL